MIISYTGKFFTEAQFVVLDDIGTEITISIIITNGGLKITHISRGQTK